MTRLCLLLLMTVMFLSAVSASNVLFLTPLASRSVRSLCLTLAEGLAARGHTVTMVSAGDPFSSHPNITHVLAPHSSLDSMDLFELRSSPTAFRMWLKAFPTMARKLYETPKVMDLWRRRREFDAIIINSAANEMAFPFLMDVKAPFITYSPVGSEPLQLSYLGNYVSPATLPSVILPYDNDMTLWERFANTLSLFALRYAFRRAVGKPLAEALREKFPDLPDPYSMYPRQALTLLNHHHLLDGSIPLLPNQVEVGCMHCKPAKPLPEDIAEWLDGAGPEGVVYFSLGALQKSKGIPEVYRKELFEAFGRMPHRVLIKYSLESGVELPKNVRAYEWVPQQDVLGHPSVKVFISHCGVHGTAEALYHGVPILGLPITFDQPRTCARLHRRGEAIALVWEELTADALLDAVRQITQDPKYTKRVEAVSQRLRSQPEGGLDRAVRWVEYAITYGDDFLQYAGARLPFYQYLLLDVMAILLVLLAIVSGASWICLRKIYKWFYPSGVKGKLD
ncbi:UDP-glucosyltransferase 2-like [Oratosquilla oratoria]|uniref:UDP-glucosyltransferase 2-like n=1 Tax=Oratosquilla oratoria TaxID=337810 RepID=UPI003F76950B